MSSFRCGLQVSRKNVITNEIHNHPRGKQISCMMGDDMLGNKESNLTTDVISSEAQNELDLEKVNKADILKQMGPDEQEGKGLLEYIYKLPIKKIVSQLPLRKIGEKALTTVSNAFPSSDENARPMFDGEYHAIVKLPNGKYGRANYTSPGTRVIQRIKRGDPPRVLSDKVSQAHDIRYTLAKNTADVREADKKMVRDLKQLSREGTDSQVNIQPALRGIQGKMIAEDFSLLSRDKFINVRNQPNESDKMMLENKLKQLEQQGYGSVKSMAKRGSNIRGRPQVDRRGYRSLLERVKNNQNTKGSMRNGNFQRGGAQTPGPQANASSEYINISTASKQNGRGYPGSNMTQVGSGTVLPGSGYKKKKAFPADKLLKKMAKRVKKSNISKGKYSGTKRKPVYVHERDISGFLAKTLAPMVMSH